MRLDKFLKLTRIIKRRTSCKEFIQGERVQINDKIAKPSSTVKEGDIIKLAFGNKEITIKVIQILNSTKKQDSENMYELIEEKSIQEKEVEQ